MLLTERRCRNCRHLRNPWKGEPIERNWYYCGIPMPAVEGLPESWRLTQYMTQPGRGEDCAGWEGN